MTLSGIRRAAEGLRGAIAATPCSHSLTLSEISGAEVWLKFENLQFVGCFKGRGARTRLLSLDADARKRGVIAMSAGNHAQGVARHAQLLEIPATIVMPLTTPGVKVEYTRGFGARVLLYGDSLEAAGRQALELSEREGLAFVHPYDDDDVIRGQGTVALEMLESNPGLEMLVIPVGGGGLCAGCALAARALEPSIEVIGVESERYPSMHQALRGERIECSGRTIADGIAVAAPGERTLPLIREYVSEILTVSEVDLERAILLLLEVEKTLVEGAGAAGLAAVLQKRDRFAGRRVGIVLSGGNIDQMALSNLLQRGLVRARRLVRLRIELVDQPGALAQLSSRIGEAGANIVEVQHNRAFSPTEPRQVEVEIVIETRGPEHLCETLESLESAGFPARAVTS